MHLMYCDESNMDPKRGDFLLYGGVVVNAEQAPSLSASIDGILTEANVPADYRLKFNPGPKDMSHSDFIALKQAVFEAMHEHNVRMIAYVVLHNIARDPALARRNGINTVSYNFDRFLDRARTPGLVLIDRFNDANNAIDHHLVQKFSHGVIFEPGQRKRRLRNILGFHYSAIGQSHFPSLVDIAVGSLRFAINAHTRNEVKNQAGAKRLISLLAPLFENGKNGVPELAFCFSPKAVGFDGFRRRYLALQEFLAEAGIRTAQKIEAV